MNNQEYVTAYIPFEGFYESHYSYDIEDHIEQEIDHFNNCHCTDFTHCDVSYTVDHEGIARSYTNSFISLLEKHYDLKLDYEFSRLISPKFYNYETDTIEIKLSKESLLALYKKRNPELFKEFVYKELKERDGFFPFYDNDIETWDDDITNWAIPQIELLLHHLTWQMLGLDSHLYGDLYMLIHDEQHFHECYWQHIDIDFPELEED